MRRLPFFPEDEELPLSRVLKALTRWPGCAGSVGAVDWQWQQRLASCRLAASSREYR